MLGLNASRIGKHLNIHKMTIKLFKVESGVGQESAHIWYDYATVFLLIFLMLLPTSSLDLRLYVIGAKRMSRFFNLNIFSSSLASKPVCSKEREEKKFRLSSSSKSFNDQLENCAARALTSVHELT